MTDTQRTEHLIRREYDDKHIEWVRLPHDLEGYEADVLEEAYQLGRANDINRSRIG
jgi:hypothetical protein